MFAKFSTNRRSRQQHVRKPYRPVAETLEGRRLLAVDTISYVDANNNGAFDAGTDIDVSAEVADGKFDTQKAEGAYTTPIAGAGLYISTVDQAAGINVPGDIKFKADGDLVINTNLTSGDDIKLESRNGSVSLDDPTITAVDEIEIEAALDIVSVDDVISATGPKSEVELEAGRDIVMSGTAVSAEREVELEAGGIIDFGNSPANPGTITAFGPKGEVELEAELTIDVTDATIDAGREIDLESEAGEIIADNASIGASTTLTPSREVELEAFGHIMADGATIYGREVELESDTGSVLAPNSFLGSATTREVELEAAVDIDVANAELTATREIELEAGGNINADNADMDATGSSRGDVELEADGNISAIDAIFAAGDDVELTSNGGNVDATRATFTADDVELDAAIDLLYCAANVTGDLDTDWGGVVDPLAC